MTALARMLVTFATAADFTSDDPVLSRGEMGVETDTDKLKIGDGATAWASLPYVAGGGGGSGTVTSVNVTGSTGITPGGVPITTSGTITLTLSTNLQSWSGISPASKLDASAVGTAAAKNTGTSGNTVPLLDGANTWSATQIIQGEVHADGAGAAVSIDRRDTGAKKWVLYSAAGDLQFYNNAVGNEPMVLSDAGILTLLASPAAADNSTKAATTAFVKSERKFSYIGQATVAGAAATVITISGLDLDADGEYMVEVCAVNATGSAASASLYYNADTTATNYNRENLGALSTTVAGTRANDGFIGSLDASSPMNVRIWIRRDAAGRVYAQANVRRGAHTALGLQIVQHVWTTAGTNVTGITISSSVASSFSIGDYVRVYRVKP